MSPDTILSSMFYCGKIHITSNLPFNHFKVYSSVAFSLFTVLSNNHHHLFQNIFVTLNRNPKPTEQLILIFLFPQILESSNLLFVFLNLDILDMSYKWSHTVCCILCLGYFSQHNVCSFMLQHITQLCWSISCWVASPLGYCQQCCYAHLCTNFHLKTCFQFFWVYSQEWSHMVIAESYGSSKFKLLKNHQTIFHHGCTILHFHWECLRAPMSIHPHQHLFLFCF